MRWATVVVTCALASAASGQPAYVGSSKCRVCHPAEHLAWSATAHARTFARLPENARSDSRCLECHATGGTAAFPEVGCEACHGPGSEYRALSVMISRDAAIAAGLRIADAAGCERCHRGAAPHALRPFAFEDARAKGVHPIAEREGAAGPAGGP